MWDTEEWISLARKVMDDDGCGLLGRVLALLVFMAESKPDPFGPRPSDMCERMAEFCEREAAGT
jgi:hypothetical protein